MIWILMAVVVIVVLAVVLWPVLRAPSATKDRATYDMEVFQDQLKEVDRDIVRGVLTEAEAVSARIEIQRRILSAGRADVEAHQTSSRGKRIALAGGVAIAIPALALGIYLSVGAPALVDGVSIDNESANADVQDEAERAVLRLADKVARDPTNVENLFLLARSYRETRQWDDAVKTYKQLLELKPDADTYANYGEALTVQAGGRVTPGAHDAFLKTLGLDRTEPRSRFYLGLEQAENNNPRDAIAIWRDLTTSAPQDAPWLNTVRQQMAQVAQSASIAPMSVEPRHPLDGAPLASAAPSHPAPAPTASFSPEQRQMIEGMVGGLAARMEQSPEDFSGWMMLGRSYTVLQKPEDAAKAYEKAVTLKPAELEPKLQLESALLATVDPEAAAPLPARLVSVAHEILTLHPEQPEALFVAGLDRAKAGDKPGARKFWNAAQKTGAPALQDEITRRLKALN